MIFRTINIPSKGRKKYATSSGGSGGVIVAGGGTSSSSSSSGNTTTIINNYVTEGGGEWYTLSHAKQFYKDSSGKTQYTLGAKVENWESKLTNQDEYRFFLVRWRKKRHEGWQWRIPFRSPRWDANGNVINTKTQSIIDWEDTWWGVASRKVTPLWNTTGKIWQNVITHNFTKSANGKTYYNNTKSKHIRFGCALFHKNDKGGWDRCSNIIGYEVYLTDTAEYLLTSLIND